MHSSPRLPSLPTPLVGRRGERAIKSWNRVLGSLVYPCSDCQHGRGVRREEAYLFASSADAWRIETRWMIFAYIHTHMTRIDRRALARCAHVINIYDRLATP
jgi:hypothetical protein